MSEEFQNENDPAEEPTPEVTEAATTDDAADENVKPKKKGKGKIVLIIIAALVVVLGGGGAGVYFGFHDKPAFCNAVCHTPMDPYVVSYDEGTSILPIQAAAQAEAQGTEQPITLSVTLHKESDQALNCLDCHEPSIGEQVNEAIKWVTGDYTLPLVPFDVVPSATPREGQKSAQEFCLRAECHEGVSNMDELKQYMADQSRNPHNSHLGEQACSNCHKTHEQSVMVCTQCHNDAPMPEGWLTYAEQQRQEKEAAEAAEAGV
jgi:flagellar basal body-associated protein FliL